ncbi:MAG: tetratricopeptide repeat protein, partial [Planctomycetota bacterium]
TRLGWRPVRSRPVSGPITARASAPLPLVASSVVDLWLGLESQYGNRERAMEVRERTFSNNQGNFDNAYAYVLMLLEDERYADADAAITEMETRPGVGQLRVAELRALSLAEQEQVAEGRAVLTGFIDNTPEADRTVDPFIALGLFEQRHGDVQDAIAAFEAGRPYQDPETAVADRALGDLLARLGEVSRRQVPASRDEDPEAYDRLSAEADAYFERAVEVFERAQASMSTPDPALSKQIARVLARLDRQSDAIAILNDLENPEDKEALMMKADFAVSNGNVREARTILNRVVELYPNDPQGFFMRARVNAVETVDGQTQINETMLPDVMADLDQAVSLNPEFLQAWELRFQIYQSLGEFDRAFNQLTEAIEASPDNHELRWLLVNRLQAFGELDRAQAQAVIGARANPESERWLERAGFLSFITRRYRESAELYQQLYDLTENPGKASDVLNALLRRDPEPTRAEVNRLLQIVRDVKDADAPTMMLWARAHDFLGNTSNAEQLTQQAYEKAKVSSAQARIWFDALVQRLDDDPDKAFVYLEDFARKLENRGEQLPVYIRLLETQNNFQKTADASAALAALDSMQPEIEDDGWAMLQLYRIQNQVYYALGRFEDVADACRAGLKLFPRDLEFNNNLAYTLAKHLDEPELARQYAERAAELAPLNSAVLDTLGWVRYEAAIKSDGLERDQGLRDSVAILERAIRTSSNVNERVPPLIHMGNAQLALGEMEEANRYRDLARDAIRQAREGIQQEYQAEFEALTNAIAGGRR